MRRLPSLREWAAALTAVLLPFVVSGGAAAQTITNVAEARWTYQGTEFTASSNEVSVQVTDSPPEIKTYRRNPGGGFDLTYVPAQCSGSGVAPQSSGPPGAITSTVTQTTALNAGTTLLFEISAASANLDPAAIDRLTVVIGASGGDRK